MRHPHPIHLANVVPGLRTSATFLTSLSANLRLPDDDLYPSPLGTPYLRGVADHPPFPPPSPLTAAMSLAAADAAELSLTPNSNPGGDTSATAGEDPTHGSQNSLRDLPTLATYSATSKTDRVAGLKLIADSVAQQRQKASSALILHPICLAGWVAMIAAVWQRFYKTPGDAAIVVTTGAGLTIACLMAVRFFTDGYIKAAEEVTWDWLGDDVMLVTKWGEEIIAALVLGWAKDEGKRKRKGGRGMIRGWAVRLKYRGKGVGGELLKEAVDIVSKKGGDGIEFADDHANSARILPAIFNGPFERDDQRARNALQHVVEEKGAFSRSRRQRTP